MNSVVWKELMNVFERVDIVGLLYCWYWGTSHKGSPMGLKCYYFSLGSWII